MGTELSTEERAPAPPDAPRRLRGVLLACVLATLAIGVAKLVYQRAHPPKWAEPPINSYEGFVSIDLYAERAERIRAFLTGDDPGAHELADYLRASYHPTSLTVPGLVALVAIPLGSIPWSFVVVSSACFLLEVALVMRLARRLAPPGSDVAGVGLSAGILLAAHCLSARTAAQLHLDAACAALVVGGLLAADAWCREPGVPRALALLAVLVAALFTKASCLPLLFVPAAAAWLNPPLGCPRWLAVGRGLAMSAVAALIALAYLQGLEDAVSGADDMQHLLGTWTLRRDQLVRFALEMALLFQFFPLVLFLPRAVLVRPLAKLTALAVLVFLAATWAFHLPAVPRLYLPVLALLAPLAAVAFRNLLEPPLGRRVLAVFLGVNYAIGIGGIFAGG